MLPVEAGMPWVGWLPFHLGIGSLTSTVGVIITFLSREADGRSE